MTAGCSSVDLRHTFWGISPEDASLMAAKYSQVFDKSSQALWDETLSILDKDMQALIDKQDKKTNFIVAYRFDKAYPAVIDTTVVGIQIIPKEGGKNEVVVFSDNAHLAKAVSVELFMVLSGGEPTKPVNPAPKARAHKSSKRLQY